jgi:hypothetical protein
MKKGKRHATPPAWSSGLAIPTTRREGLQL